MSYKLTLNCTNDFIEKFINIEITNAEKWDENTYKNYFHLIWETTPGPIDNIFTFIVNKEKWKELQDALFKYWHTIEVEENTYEFVGNFYIFKLNE